ncbi:MAG TPA: hypothetical protein VER96_04275 [Polyangiaceae bacterium]|nr:hypothetical protein [Polyangiaceae bacterium]
MSTHGISESAVREDKPDIPVRVLNGSTFYCRRVTVQNVDNAPPRVPCISHFVDFGSPFLLSGQRELSCFVEQCARLRHVVVPSRLLSQSE